MRRENNVGTKLLTLNNRLLPHVPQIVWQAKKQGNSIDEGTKSLGSDRKRIKIKFGASEPEQQTQERVGKPKLSEAQIQKKST